MNFRAPKLLLAALQMLLLTLIRAPAFADTLVTGTLTITNASNITGTNGESITINGDARTWTNNVAAPPTQIQASSTNSVAVQLALVHFATYPVSGLQLTSDGATWLAWRGSAVTVALSGTNWGSVSYVTNTAGPGTPIKLLYSMAAISASSAVTNFIPDFDGKDCQVITAVSDVNLSSSANQHAVRKITVLIDPNGTNRTLTFNTNWGLPSSITLASTNLGVLSLTSLGANESDVFGVFELKGSSGGVQSINGDATSAQVLTSGTAGTDFAISTSSGTTTFNLPTASGSNRGALSSTDWSAFNGKQPGDSDLNSLAAGITGIVKGAGDGGGYSAASSGTDYAPATSGSAILKGNGAGGFASAASGTDYAPATSGSAILKGNGAGGFASAASGADYAPATSGSAILKGDGAGGFASATAGTDYLDPSYISDAAYNATTWDGDTNHAPSKNAVRDEIQALILGGGAGVTSINGDTTSAQVLTNGAAGTDFAISTSSGTTTFNLPTASGSNRGALSSTDWTTFNGKLGSAAIDDTAYNATTWDGDTNHAPSKNAVRDEIQALNRTRSLKFNFPRTVDGSGCTIPNTNNFTSGSFMVPQFSGSAATNANYMCFGVRIPSDLDTNVDLTASLTVSLGNTDTAAQTYYLGMISVANSAAIAATAANWIVLSLSADAAGASGDVESLGPVTLTGWKAAVTPGQWWFIELSRDGANDASTVGSNFQELEIFYSHTE